MKILNAAGQPIKLSKRESLIANNLKKSVNALGYEIDISTLTTIMKKVSEQKFFEIAPADFIPVKVGEGAWSAQLTTYRSFEMGDDFDNGIINTGANNSRLAVADAAVDSLSVPVFNWAKSIGWTLFDLQLASKSGNWDVVVAKEKSRKKNWDLGIQKVAFLGTSNSKGLLNQTGIETNTSIMTAALKTMTAAQMSTFLGVLLSTYRTNCSQTTMPTHFVIPESDFLGLAVPTSSDYPIKSKLELMQDTLKVLTNNPNFKILPCAYADTANSGLTYPRYALYNYEEESIRMDIPVDYTNTLANSIDNFSFQNVGYGQFTGALAYRPKEMLYLDLT